MVLISVTVCRTVDLLSTKIVIFSPTFGIYGTSGGVKSLAQNMVSKPASVCPLTITRQFSFLHVPKDMGFTI
jgi:hypothetical protein